jgi:hypothetical protein
MHITRASVVICETRMWFVVRVVGFTTGHRTMSILLPQFNRAIAQAVSRRLLTVEAWVRSRFVVDKLALGQFFTCQYQFHRCSIFIHVSSGGWT